jgi:cell division protein FtsX
MAIVAFGLGYYFQNKGFISFLSGFIGVAMLWFVVAYRIDASTQSVLTEKINRIFPLNVFLLMVIVGGLVGGFAALTGALINPKRTAKYY